MGSSLVKKIIIFVLFCSYFYGNKSFAYLEDKAYCLVDKDYIEVSMWKKGSYKCSDYISTIDQSIKLVYKDIVTMQIYILKGQDVEYRKSIKLLKESELDKLQNLRANVLYNIKIFETNLFKKLREYMLYYLASYEGEARRTIIGLQESGLPAISGNTLLSEVTNYIARLQSDLQKIESIRSSRNLLELLKLIPDYLYLRKQVGK